MEFDEEASKDLEEDISLSSSEVDIAEDLSFDEIGYLGETENIDSSLKEIEVKGKTRHSSQRSLKVRRAIEDYLEHKRLSKELDYLTEKDFLEDGESED